MKYTFKNICKQYETLMSIIGEQEMFSLTADEALRFQDVLSLLEERGYIGSVQLDHGSVYKTFGSLNDFNDWLQVQEKEEKRLSRREWKIAIISALIGGVLGLIPTLISLI